MKRMIFLLAGLGFAMPVSASPSVPLKCGANTERIWVYDNLTTLDVSVRLKCGTPVDILGLEKGYVKVRTADGDEGYVPPEAIPSSELAALTAAVAPPPTVETLAGAARANAVASAQPATIAPTMIVRAAAENQQREVSVPTPAPAPVMIAARVAAGSAPAPTPAPPVRTVPEAPAPAPSPAEQSRPAPIIVPTPAPAPAPTQIPAPAPSAPAIRVASASAPTAPQRPAIVSKAPVMTASAANTYVASNVSVGSPAPARPAAPVAPVTPVTLKPHDSPTPAPPVAQPAARGNATLTVEATSGPIIPTPQVVTVVRTADITPASKRFVVSPVHKPEFSDDDEDTPEAVSTTDDLSACSIYFSAYGVTPMQQKWIADERKKRFPGVCPAPEPYMVDYVLIFTHDMDYFTTTLPDAIHTDRNGFSDWSPVTAVDDTMIPASALDKARHEYAWVFRVHRGTFDPSKFTSRRKPQFTKTESSSRASSKSIEDAMQFMVENTLAQ